MEVPHSGACLAGCLAGYSEPAWLDAWPAILSLPGCTPGRLFKPPLLFCTNWRRTTEPRLLSRTRRDSQCKAFLGRFPIDSRSHHCGGIPREPLLRPRRQTQGFCVRAHENIGSFCGQVAHSKACPKVAGLLAPIPGHRRRAIIAPTLLPTWGHVPASS